MIVGALYRSLLNLNIDLTFSPTSLVHFMMEKPSTILAVFFYGFFHHCRKDSTGHWIWAKYLKGDTIPSKTVTGSIFDLNHIAMLRSRSKENWSLTFETENQDFPRCRFQLGSLLPNLDNNRDWQLLKSRSRFPGLSRLKLLNSHESLCIQANLGKQKCLMANSYLDIE